MLIYHEKTDFRESNNLREMKRSYLSGLTKWCGKRKAFELIGNPVTTKMEKNDHLCHLAFEALHVEGKIKCTSFITCRLIISLLSVICTMC